MSHWIRKDFQAVRFVAHVSLSIVFFHLSARLSHLKVKDYFNQKSFIYSLQNNQHLTNMKSCQIEDFILFNVLLCQEIMNYDASRR